MKIRRRKLQRSNGGTARSYADYHIRRHAEDILGRTYTEEDAARFDRIYRSRAGA